MYKSRKKKEFRPGGYDSLEERVVLSQGVAGRLAERVRALHATAVEQSAVRGQLRSQPFARSAQLGRRQFPLARTTGGAGGVGLNTFGFNPIVTSLGFSDPTATAAALRASNTATSVTGPNLTPDVSGFINPGLNVSNLAQAVAAGTTVNTLGLNSGLSNFNGRGMGNGLFSNGLGFISSQSLLGNLASTIDPSLNLTANDLNRGLVTFGGLTSTGTFGLANALRNANRPGFNGGLGLNNNLGFSTTPSSTTVGTPLSNLTSFNVLGLNRGIRNTTGLPVNPTTGIDFGVGTPVNPTTGFPINNGTGTGGTGTGGTSFGGTSGTSADGTSPSGFGGMSGVVPA